MASFNQFIQSFSDNPNKKGDQFEYFVKEFLKNDPYWKSQVKTVWPFKEFPINWGPDIGTDLIFEDHDGKYWAVQAKKYDPEHSVTKEDINSFLSDSNRPNIHKRLLIISTNKISNNGLKTIKDQEKKVVVFRLQDFEDRGDIYPDNLSDLLNFKLHEPPKPRPHQEKAIKDVVEGFKTSSKGQLIMACGTGKTYTYFWIHKDLKSNQTLVLVPSLNLLSQTLQEWIKANGSSFRSLCVCSDPTTVKNVQEDEIILEQSDLPYTVSWDVDEITSFLKRPEPTIIFSTYQSSDLIAEAQKNVPNHIFDLSIADEAHRCTGKADSDFTIILDDQKIRSHKKLFGTATPKLYKSYIKKTAQDKDIEIIDMNDEGKFGNVFHNLSFGKAIKQNLLADYQVIVVGVNDARVKEMIDHREFISIKENHKSDAMSLATQVGFIKAIKDYNLSRLVTFHGRVKKASDFSKSLPEIFKWTKSEYKGNKELEIDYVSGKMQTNERRRKLSNLKNSESNQISILSNARCLSEGIDVPHMDGIAFINPKSSEIDIVQSIGRAIRKPDDSKSIGYIILPVFIADKNTVEESIENSNFEPVWKVMNALKSHDEDFKIELDNLRINTGKTGITGRTSKFVFDLPTKIASTFQERINTFLIEKVTESWYFYFGLLEQYYIEFKTSKVPQDKVYKNIRLGRWRHKQITRFKDKTLSQERINKLEQSFKDWSWDPLGDIWLEKFNLLKKYYKKYKTSRVTQGTIFEGVTLHEFVLRQRNMYKAKKLTQNRIDALENAFHDWSWFILDDLWSKHFKILEEFYLRFKTSRVPQDKVYKSFTIGSWVARHRGLYKNGKLDQEKIIKFEQSFDDWVWNLADDDWNKNFNLLEQYQKEFKNSKVPPKKIYKKIKLGSWVARQRFEYQKKNLTKYKIKKFENTFKDWTWNHSDQENWLHKFELLKAYYVKHKTSRVPESGVNSIKELSVWIRSQIKTYKKGSLSKEKIKTLQQTFHDWTWNKTLDDWFEKLDIVKNYYEEFKTLKIPEGTIFKKVDIQNWISRQRTNYNKGKLSQEKIKKIEQTIPDWSWESTIIKEWFEKLDIVKNYYEEFKTLKIPEGTIFKKVDIQKWIYRQRTNYNKGKLSQERIKKIEQTIPDWSWQKK